MLPVGFKQSSVLQSMLHVDRSVLCVVGIIPMTSLGFLMVYLMFLRDGARTYGTVVRLSAGTRKFSLLYGCESSPGVKWTLREAGYFCLGSRLRMSDAIPQLLSWCAQRYLLVLPIVSKDCASS
jgi:hypothetical protein